MVNLLDAKKITEADMKKLLFTVREDALVVELILDLPKEINGIPVVLGYWEDYLKNEGRGHGR